jgi:hypothetical protein
MHVHILGKKPLDYPRWNRQPNASQNDKPNNCSH